MLALGCTARGTVFEVWLRLRDPRHHDAQGQFDPLRVCLHWLMRTGAATGTQLWTIALPTNTQDVPQCGAQYSRGEGTLWRAPQCDIIVVG